MRRALLLAGAVVAGLAGSGETARAAECPDGQVAVDLRCTHPQTDIECTVWVIAEGERVCVPARFVA